MAASTCLGMLAAASTCGAVAHLPASSSAPASSSDRDCAASPSSSRSCLLTSSFHGHARLGSQLGTSGRLVDNRFLSSTSSWRRREGKTGVAVAMAPPPAAKKGGKAKKVVGLVKLALEAGKATPAPPVGPALGAKGVNIMNFCKEYNAQTADKPGFIIPVEITVYDVAALPWYIMFLLIYQKRNLSVEKGSNQPNKDKVGKVTSAQILEIAKEKLPDLNCTSLDSAQRIIRGTARNMGIDVLEAV
ncbi:hypothetical protein CBR_g23337 [Chara braunii]|uniref:Large ribosomal subunit protein uL11m n=1 Tax=Chara braunii TaxID=69332 RepID=A0A388L3Y4_CHABU|nr:hypothetical protein CBR_g23337 [Chara braunii]|eukprot:GBG77007.1 hypothetical protein CBR_g23337 [Chara braunii]